MIHRKMLRIFGKPPNLLVFTIYFPGHGVPTGKEEETAARRAAAGWKIILNLRSFSCLLTKTYKLPATFYKLVLLPLRQILIANINSLFLLNDNIVLTMKIPYLVSNIDH